MHIAILLYGYFYIDPMMNLWRASHSKSVLKRYSFVEDGYPYFMDSIYLPLVEKYQNVDVYMITHEFAHPKFQEIKQELLNTCPHFTIFFTNQNESPRLPYTHLNLLKHVTSTNKKYDRYIITRGDLYYKNKITNWMPQYLPEKEACWFVFKDHKRAWEDIRAISDIIFIIDNNIEKFKRSVINQIELSPERTELHHIYHLLKAHFGPNLNFIVDGYYDSNTSKKIKESNNPIYIMINRPYYFDLNGNYKNADQEPTLFRKIKQSLQGSISGMQFKHQVERTYLQLQPIWKKNEEHIHPTIQTQRAHRNPETEKPTIFQNQKTAPFQIPKTIQENTFGKISNPIFNAKVNQIFELYKQRIHEKLEKQKQQRSHLATIVPEKIDGLILRQRIQTAN